MAASLTNVSSALTSNSAKAASGSTKKILSQEDFLNLFVTQMRYQNPLEPMDNYQMASQMAQMTSVESLKNIYDSVEKLAASQASYTSFQASGLIGKKVEYPGNALTLNQGAVSEAYYQLASPGKALLQVYDRAGNLVWQSGAGTKDTTRQKFEWNGRNLRGTQVPDGTYLFKVSATDANGNAVSVATRNVGAVSAVSLENGSASLQVGGSKISLNDITGILN